MEVRMGELHIHTRVGGLSGLLEGDQIRSINQWFGRLDLLDLVLMPPHEVCEPCLLTRVYSYGPAHLNSWSFQLG